MEEFAFGPTASRKVLGCLNEAMFALCHEFEHPRFSSVTELEDYFATFIYRATQYQPPHELAVKLFTASNSVSNGNVHQTN